MGGIAERSVGARGFGHVMLECTDRLTVVQTLIQYPKWVGNRSDRLYSISAAECSQGQARRRAADGNATAAGGRYRRRSSLRQYNVACIRAFIPVCSCVFVIDSWCRQWRGCACFPGCAVATPRTGVPSQGQCIPPIARARFGAPRRCDALRFLLPLQAVKKTAISQKAQRGRDTTVASRYTGCWHTRCRQSTMPRFHGTACSEARCIPQAM